MLDVIQISSKCFETQKTWLNLQCDQQVQVSLKGSKLCLLGRKIIREGELNIPGSIENMFGVTQTSSKCFETQRTWLVLQYDQQVQVRPKGSKLSL